MATTTRSCKGMKVVSSRTLELRSALSQIWKERKTLSIMQQCLQANCPPPPPPPPHSFTHQTLLGRVLGMLSILTAAMYGRQFHQSFHPSRLHHAFSYMILKKLEKISGSDHSFVGFCHPETTEQPHFEDCS